MASTLEKKLTMLRKEINRRLPRVVSQWATPSFQHNYYLEQNKASWKSITDSISKPLLFPAHYQAGKLFLFITGNRKLVPASSPFYITESG
uniref:Uncharacterized protein n=1 Tax=Anguilla anguilla TaxID=7936 RepID=A0A0E9X2I3_ANGAN